MQERFTISIPPDLKADIETARGRVSRSRYIADILREHIPKGR